jgi:hypothetical protein
MTDDIEPKRSRTKDQLMLLGTAIIVATTGVSAFLLADEFHIGSEWVFFGIVSLSFFPMCGWQFRSRFKSVGFALFFGVWMIVHGALFVWAMKIWGWSGWFTAVIVELMVFYISLRLIFNIRPPSRDTGTDSPDMSGLTGL